MPTTTARLDHHQASRRDSWPPTQMRLFNSIESEDIHPMQMDKHDDHAHSFIHDDEDPLNSFLTPTPLLDDGDTDEEDADMDGMGFAFDAGIEDPQNPSPVVRSISPSQLASGGLPRPPSTTPRAIPVPIRTPSPTNHNNHHHHHHHHLPHHLNHHHFLRAGSYSPPSRNSTPEITTPMLDDDNDNDNDYDDDDDEEEEDYVRLTPRGGLLAVPRPSSPFHPGGSSSSSSKSSRASKMRRAKTAAVSAAKAQEKEEDRIALMTMMARGSRLHHHYDNSDDEDDDDGGDALPSSLAPSPEFHIGSPPTALRRSSLSRSHSSSNTTTIATRGRSARPAFGRPPPVVLPARPRSWSGAGGGGYGNGRSSPRAWREPSPDVWSIEEEEEEEEEEMVMEDEMDVDASREHHPYEEKSKKRVRFAWPVREEIP